VKYLIIPLIIIALCSCRTARDTSIILHDLPIGSPYSGRLAITPWTYIGQDDEWLFLDYQYGEGPNIKVCEYKVAKSDTSLIGVIPIGTRVYLNKYDAKLIVATDPDIHKRIKK
jgi:hypothetical protein